MEKGLLYIFVLLYLFVFGCKQSLDDTKLEQMLSSMAEGPVVTLPTVGNSAANPPTQTSGTGTRTTTSGLTNPLQIGDTSVVGGVPRMVTEGFCGDGIINGNEYCDGKAVDDKECTRLHGLSGIITCDQNCLLDISQCVTPVVDEVIGGVAENCNCNCDGSICNGGCTPSNAATVSTCLFDCDQDCICNCEKFLEGHLGRCRVRCFCQMDDSGFPDCECTINDCIATLSIQHNIASKVK